MYEWQKQIEHGPFNYEQENCSVEGKIENAMAAFDYRTVF